MGVVVVGQLPEAFEFIWRFWGGFFLVIRRVSPL